MNRVRNERPAGRRRAAERFPVSGVEGWKITVEGGGAVTMVRRPPLSLQRKNKALMHALHGAQAAACRAAFTASDWRPLRGRRDATRPLGSLDLCGDGVSAGGGGARGGEGGGCRDVRCHRGHGGGAAMKRKKETQAAAAVIRAADSRPLSLDYSNTSRQQPLGATTCAPMFTMQAGP